MLAWVASRLERRPRDRRLGEKSGAKRPKGSHVFQPREIGEQALVHVLGSQYRVLSIEPEYDHTTNPRGGQRLATPNTLEDPSDRPRQKRQERQERGEEDNEDR